MIHFRDTDHVREEVAGRLGRDPGDRIWELFAVKYGYLDQVLQEVASEQQEDALNALVELIRDVWSANQESNLEPGGAGREPGVSHPPAVEAVKQAQQGRALATLSEINVIEASALPDVRRFRETVLGGQTLSVESDAWRTWAECHPESRDKLDQLISLLGSGYGWEPAAAQRFILTGHGPEPSAYFSAVQILRYPGRLRSHRVTISATPLAVSRRDLLDACRGLPGFPRRARFFRDRSVKRLNAALAIEAAKAATDGLTWLTAMERWNARARADGLKQYLTEKHFGAAARRAYELVTGDKLEWPNPSGRPRSSK